MRGFSLIEVNLAVLLIAVGLLTLFALFPLGLRESEMAVDDTQEAMFADSVLSAMEGNAMAIKEFSQWENLGAFCANVSFGVYPVNAGTWFNSEIGNVNQATNLGTSGSVIFPQGSERRIRYRLIVNDAVVDEKKQKKSERRKIAVLEVKSGANFKDPRVYYTEFFYFGT